MDETNSVIYGLELQARAMAPQQAENNEIRFFIATQSLKPNNQIHLVEFNEETSTLKSNIFSNPLGEVWKLNTSPHDAKTLVVVTTSYKGTREMNMQSAILTLPESFSEQEGFLSFQNTEILPTKDYGIDIKTTEFHPTDTKTLATVIDGKVVLFDRGESKSRLVTEINDKNAPKLTTGKWSQHHQGNQFITLHDCCIRSYDIRDANNSAWVIEDAHCQLVRDLDCNPNKQCHIVTGGDDGCMKIWDCRMPKDPVFARSDQAHWIWSVRFNTFHDQLILSSGSDCKVMLTCAASVSSETVEEEASSGAEGAEATKQRLADGLLQTFDQHEESVYCVEWSTVDPWIFASLSYDGRAIISRVPKQFKYQILF